MVTHRVGRILCPQWYNLPVYGSRDEAVVCSSQCQGYASRIVFRQSPFAMVWTASSSPPFVALNRPRCQRRRLHRIQADGKRIFPDPTLAVLGDRASRVGVRLGRVRDKFEGAIGVRQASSHRFRIPVGCRARSNQHHHRSQGVYGRSRSGQFIASPNPRSYT